MQFISIETELTTAITDLILGLFTLYVVVSLFRKRADIKPAKKPVVWVLSFAFLVIASFLGFIAHGFEMSDGFRNFLWQPLYLSLGLTIAMFALGVVIDLRGKNPEPWMLPVFIVIALLFYAVTLVFPESFLVFIAYEAAAMLFALVSYIIVARRPGRKDAFWLATGILLSIVAAALQSMEFLVVTVIWEFDHNSFFHVVQLAGVACLYKGLTMGADA